MEGSSNGGVVNKIIDVLPFELHYPGYNYCGPGTKVKKRLLRGDKGINPLDEACKEHDLIYSQSTNKSVRREADQRLINRAWERVKSKNSSLGEKIAGWTVTNAMKAKVKSGMGLKKRKKVGFNKAVIKPILKELKANKYKPVNFLSLAKKNVKVVGKKNISVPRIISIPKNGGFLLPLISGLAALGGLIGAGSSIAKVVNDVRSAKEQFNEAQRHNQTMVAITIGKKGSGLYVKPYKKGLGLVLKKKS